MRYLKVKMVPAYALIKNIFFYIGFLFYTVNLIMWWGWMCYFVIIEMNKIFLNIILCERLNALCFHPIYAV